MNTPHEILEMLGFTYVTGNLWRRKGLGMIVIPNPTTTADIVQAIYNRGYAVCQAEIRAALRIKPTFKAMKQFKESNNRMNLAKKGFKVLRAVMHWQSDTWRISYYTLKGGWARLDSYCQVSYPTREEAESDISRLVKSHPNKFIQDI